MRKLVVLFAILALGTACARSISEQTKADLAKPIDCSTAKADIQTLEDEKASVAKQISAGVRSVIPAAAVVGILRREYRDRVKVAAGGYNKDLQAKIDEIKQKCGMWP